MFYSGRISNHIFEVTIGIGTAVLVSFVTYRAFRDPKKKISRIIDTMDSLKKNTVHIRNRDYVEEVVSQLMKGGSSKLQIVADFDYTITRVHFNGVPCLSSFCVLEQSSFIKEECRVKCEALDDKYHPIEVDPHLTREQKIPLIEEWYSKSTELLSKCGFRKEYLPKCVSSANVALRDGTHSIFQSLYKHEVPVLVFSAGLGDILKEILHQNSVLFSNVKVISNNLHFDEDDVLTGIKGKVITTFTKNAFSMDNQDYFQSLSSRKNVILLGDSLGDLDMIEGFKDVDTVLKIGFLNSKIEENMDRYLDSYDIVLADDQTMEVVAGLIESIL